MFKILRIDPKVSISWLRNIDVLSDLQGRLHFFQVRRRAFCLGKAHSRVRVEGFFVQGLGMRALCV